MKAMLNETFLAVACIMGFPLAELGGSSQLCGLQEERVDFHRRILMMLDVDKQ